MLYSKNKGLAKSTQNAESDKAGLGKLRAFETGERRADTTEVASQAPRTPDQEAGALVSLRLRFRLGWGNTPAEAESDLFEFLS